MENIILAIILSLQFWCKMAWVALSAAWGNRIVKGYIFGCALALLLPGLVVPYLTINHILPDDIAKPIRDGLQNYFANNFILFLGAFVLIFVVSLFYRPVAEDQKKQREIGDLESKLKWSDSNLRISGYNSPDKKWCSIGLFNASSTDTITHLQVLLLTSTWIYKDSSTRIPADNDIPHNSREFQDGAYFRADKTIFPSDAVFIYLAKIQEHQPVLWLYPDKYPYHCRETWENNLGHEFGGTILEIELLIKGNIGNGQTKRISRRVKVTIYFEKRTIKQQVDSKIEIQGFKHEQQETEQDKETAR